MTITVNRSHLEQIKEEGIKHYPLECCGLLIGKKKEDKNILTKVIPAKNDWENQRSFFQETMAKPDLGSRENFAIAPETIVKIQKEARQQNLDIIGVYHSHPDHLAVPSEFDRAIAWQSYSYIIISIMKKKATVISSWMLNENDQFIEEKIKIMPTNPNEN